MKKIPVWIDTDTGVDDTLALLVGVRLDEIEVVGASAVCGNAYIEDTFRNCRNVLSLAGREDIKVYKGSDKPLVKELKTAPYVHGENGIGDAILEESKAEIETMDAYDALYEKAKELNGELVVVAIGPLTNIALTIRRHPDFVKYVKELDIMGGAVVGGNVTANAEFNIYCDPHAAREVFASGIFVRMFGIDVTYKAFLNDDDIDEIRSYNNKASKLFNDSTKLIYAFREKFYGTGLCQHDACPIVYLAHPDWFEVHKSGVYVETDDEETMGKTVSDHFLDEKFELRNCEIVMNLNRDKFVKLIKDIYKTY